MSFAFKRLLMRIKKQNGEKEYRLANGLKVGKNTSIYSWEGLDGNWLWLISIGDNTVISSHVTVLAHDASPCIVGCHTKLGLVKIGNNCFIGANSTVLCGTTIGDNVIVGAGSVVSSSLESGYVYAGNPVRKICSIEEYQAKHHAANIERPDLSRIRRWDDWNNSTESEKQKMIDLLSDGFGYI